nr:MAG TPA: hypothetical protein [Caudoviricetes sp.]
MVLLISLSSLLSPVTNLKVNPLIYLDLTT